jgi:predicted DNA-binding transcriptional regulator AlpA
LVARKEAPSPVPLGSRARAWLSTEVQAFVEKRVAARVEKPAAAEGAAREKTARA